MSVSGEETLHSVAEVRLGAFRCLPDDWRWREPNSIGSETYLVVPKVPVQIVPDGSEPMLATAAAVLHYPPERRFRRTLVDPDGDRCLFLAIAGDPIGPPWTQAPLAATAFALASSLEHAARGHADQLALDEGVCALQSLLLAHGPEARRRPRRAGTAAEHRELAEAAKALIASRISDTLSLEEIGAALAVSPFHLARLFRVETGYSLHEFQTALRVRMALDRLDRHQGDLARLAVDLGFTHHSHLTRSFRRAFGLPPTAWTSTIVTAKGAA